MDTVQGQPGMVGDRGARLEHVEAIAREIACAITRNVQPDEQCRSAGGQGDVERGR